METITIPRSEYLDLLELYRKMTEKFERFEQQTTENISMKEIQSLLKNGGSFDFLENEEEDIYNDSDLKLKY